MRVLICATEFLPSPGGIAIHAHQIARQLGTLGWSVAVVTPQDHVATDAVTAFNRVQPYRVFRQHLGRGVPLRETIRFLTLVAAVLRQRPNVILASGERAVWSVALVARLTRRPWIAVGHGSEFLGPRTRAGRITRAAFERADAVVLVSQYTQQWMHDAGIKPRHASVILNGASGDEFQPCLDTAMLKAKHGINGGPIILTVGAVKERKAHDVVIRALPRLVREFPGLCYVIAGRPFIQDRLAALAQSLGVAEHVQFIGAVEQHELPALYNLCDVFVMVSRTTGGRDVEGYGIVAVEAALSGKPSVVTRNTGLQEAVYDGETGILVDQDDPDGTADAIGRLLRDDALRATMGQRAHDRARAEATWELRAHSFDRLLRTLVDAH